MKRRLFWAAFALLAGIGAASAQQQESVVLGRVISTPWFDVGHRLIFSQNDNIYGTSRSAAMGGAFTSLGTDLSSMSINPAGLGMYQSSDIGFTQALSLNTMKTSSGFMSPGTLSSGGDRVSYGLNNAGIAYNVFNRSGTLTSLTLGFTYNRAANFNSRSAVRTAGEDSSIADMFQRQLNFMNMQPDVLESSGNPFYNGNIRLEEWGAVMGYQTGLAGINDEGGYGYFIGAIPSDSYFSATTRGGIYEYDFSAGVNIGNFLYLGATLGATQINYREDTSYEEEYPLSSSIRSMWYDQTTRIEGSGVTAKLGLVARPVEALRIGVAFHLPTYYTVEKSYTGAMGVESARSDTDAPLVDELHFSTAPKLLAGISGVIADATVIALDYERTWYNKIHSRGDNASDIEESKRQSGDLYKPAHTLRTGLEVRASDVLSFRAGGSYIFDFMKRKDFVTNNPTVRSGYSVSAGVGFNIGCNGYIDATYLFNRSKYTSYDYYLYEDEHNIASQYDMVNGVDRPRDYTPRRNHHMLTLTLGSRF